MSGPVYRICRKCRLTWNVSVLDPNGKIYICPQCETKEKAPSAANRPKRLRMKPKPIPKGQAYCNTSPPGAQEKG
jgi:hypothetical protein